VSLLRELGYTNVSHYPGGLMEWLEFNLPTEPPAGARPALAHPSRARSGPAESRPAAVQPHLAPRSLHHALRTSWSFRFIDALAERSVGALFWLWLEIVLGCGVAYWLMGWAFPRFALIANGTPLASGFGGLLSALYFSAVTATSLGYGDIVPVGAARALAVCEGIAGLILFGCVVSKFVSRRQEELIGQIHRIAFEDRLGRVRTNLLLVRTELQATARLCEGRDIPPPEAVARVESAAMVFVGELHAVHDLLYRPQDTPEEAVLEAILAGLASVFREFNELLACVQAQRAERPPALTASVSTMSRLAREICGDCVPREFAPALRTWMDQIQRMAGEVEQI
jgi:potassium channel LctB